MRRMKSHHGQPDEQGAILILVVFLTVTLIAMAALVVDVGALLDERRQLQNGADAGALAVAHSCVLGACDATLAEGLADANARDGDSAVDSVTYPAANQARVTTSTKNGGESILPYAFGQVLTGQKGKTVRATSTAAWGPPSSATVLPLVISECDVTQLGIGTESVIMFAKANGPCVAKDASGAFGWLSTACPAIVVVGATLPGDPGGSGPAGCLEPRLGKNVVLPVFDTVTGTGNNTRYHIVGFVAFHLTGWRFANTSSAPRPCSSPNTCVSGSFVRYLISDEIGTDTGTGVGSGVGMGSGYGVSRIFLIS
ncbi:MAG: hypothetical protein QOE93_2321 [Actinomycetota bacterium]|nr:hypothetical protein [Actinomycetota bacterium]